MINPRTWTIVTPTGYYVSKTKRSEEWPDARKYETAKNAKIKARETEDAVQIEAPNGKRFGLCK